MDTKTVIELLINSNLTWAAALTIMSIVLRGVLAALVQTIADGRKVRAEIEHEQVRAHAAAERERNEAEREQTRVMQQVRETLEDTGTITRSVLALLQPIATVPERINGAVSAMQQRAERRDGEMRTLRQAVDNLPASVLTVAAGHFDPKLDSIQAAIHALREQIERKPDTITPDMARAIQRDLATIIRLVQTAGEPTEARTPAPDHKEA